jgi:hypothetical protein
MGFAPSHQQYEVIVNDGNPQTAPTLSVGSYTLVSNPCRSAVWVPGPSVPRLAPRTLSISRRLDSLDLDTLMDLAVDLDWDAQMNEHSRAAKSLADTTLIHWITPQH